MKYSKQFYNEYFTKKLNTHINEVNQLESTIALDNSYEQSPLSCDIATLTELIIERDNVDFYTGLLKLINRKSK